MKIVRLLLLLGFITPVMAAELDINPSDPPPAKALDNEKARLNLVNQKIDDFIRSHARVKEGERILLEEVMPKSNEIVAQYSAWKEKLYLIKGILSNIDSLTDSQQDEYRSKILEVMGDLYLIKKESQALRKRISSIAGEIYAVRHYSQGYLSTVDSDSFPVESDVINKFNAYKTNILSAFDNVKIIISQDVENSMWESINTTKNIVDELFLIRSLDYPELASILAELRELTLVGEVVEPKYREAESYKYEISTAIAEYRPYAALDLYHAMQARMVELINEVEASGIAGNQVDVATAFFNNQLAEAFQFVDQPLYFPLQVKQRYSLLGTIANICMDIEDEARYDYNCAALKSIYGVNPQTVLSMDEEKLRFIEKQIDLVVLGAMGND